MKSKRSRSTLSTNADDPLPALREIASNLWWSWHPEAADLFRSADPDAYSASDGNPIIALRRVSANRWRELAGDARFMRRLARVRQRMRRDLRRRSWYQQRRATRPRGLIAYFCMEYGLHESLPLYAGGLGILAGDHLKSASDLGVPMVAIGICWHHGYTRQRIDARGRQCDTFPRLPVRDTPLCEMTTRTGRPLRVRVAMGADTVVTSVWRLDVGRVPLYLLDTDLPENAARHRRIVHTLYCTDRDARIRQEILLGIGGWRVLRALTLPIAACHLNEGHAAFLSIERVGERMRRQGVSFREALRSVRNTSVFTTHTPVPDGNETFDPELVDRYLRRDRRRLKLSREAFRDLGRVAPGEDTEPFGMTPLALRTAKYANGVAALHGQVARRMWKGLYPGRRLADVPIAHVTNGIHLRTWLHPAMGTLLDALLGGGWDERQDRADTWARAARIPDERLWALHQQLKRELVAFCRERLRAQLRRARVPGMKLAGVDRVLSPDALTIGFARRFAPYKRAPLIFTDPDRLARILNDRRRPVQIIFAGKAHPTDDLGKSLVATVVRFSRMPKFRRRVVFLEDYGMDVARHMVAGVDVWLNNPERPREASGTSGMKPALHGGLNLSILDGWWPEGYRRGNGWVIGDGKDHDGDGADRRDPRAIYQTLQEKVVPLYYDRTPDDLPRRWVASMKRALVTIPAFFNTHRQVKEYVTRYYLPAMKNGQCRGYSIQSRDRRSEPGPPIRAATADQSRDRLIRAATVRERSIAHTAPLRSRL